MSLFSSTNNPGFSNQGDEFTQAEEIKLIQIAGLVDPNADRILFWDDSAGSYAYLAAGTGLTITGTTIDATSGTGDVVGPASSTDNAIARFDSTTGKLLQDSVVTIGDTGITAGMTSLSINGATIGANALAVTGTTSTGAITSTGLHTISLAGNGLRVTNSTDGTNNQAAIFESDRATPANGDNVYTSYFLSDSAGTQTEFGRLSVFATTVTDAAEDGEFRMQVMINGVSTAKYRFTGTAMLPATNDGAALGTATISWSDLALASGATIRIANTDWLATHTTGILTVGTGDLRVTTAGTNTASVVTVGGTQTLTSKTLTSPVINTATIGTSLVPTSSDGAALGSSTLMFSDLFLADGGVINWNNGNAVLTHSSGILTISTGDLRVTTAGTNSASAVTVGGTQTLTNKTLTSPVLTTPSAFTTGGNITLAENTSIALDPAGSADGKYSGITIAGTAGATLAFGDLVYLAAADSRWELADADAATTADRMLGMCVLAAASDGDPTVLLLIGQIRADAAFPALTIGSAVYVGETAGDIQVAIPTGADNVIRRVGYALTADEIYFNPSMDSQISVA